MERILNFSVFLTLLFGTARIYPSISPQCEGLFFKTQMELKDKHLESAQSNLQLLMARCPDSPEAMELSARVQMAARNWEEATKIFQKLYASSIKDSTSIGHYCFQLGVLSFFQGHLEESEKFLKEAIDHQSNLDASHFFLGQVYFQQKRMNESRGEFHQVKETELLKPLADYHNAHIDFEEGNTFQGYEALVETQLNESHDNLLQGIIKSSLTKLQNEDRDQWVKWVGIATDYDSNIFILPNSSDSGSSVTTRSLKESLALRLAYATSPVKKNRYIGFYQGSVNYNFDSATSQGQFVAQDLGGSWTYGFLNRFQYGARISGTGTWQYRSSAFRPYSLSGNAGFFVKSKISAESYVGAETSFLPSTNYLDPTLAEEDKRSGWGQQLRLFYNQIGFKKFWRPSVGLVTALMRPNGKNFQGHGVSLEVINFTALSDQWYLTQSVATGGAWYLSRPSSHRRDQSISALLRTEYLWDKALTLAAQFDFLRNFSSDSNYRFSRWVGGVSASYLF